MTPNKGFGLQTRRFLLCAAENGDNEGFVTGHDFSCADKLFILMTWALAPASLPLLTNAFFRSLFSP
jgi:hypothetical protein